MAEYSVACGVLPPGLVQSFFAVIASTICLVVIGSVASRHISFMGAQPDHNLSTMRLDTGPAAAKILRDDGVDVVLLTPV